MDIAEDDLGAGKLKGTEGNGRTPSKTLHVMKRVGFEIAAQPAFRETI